MRPLWLLASPRTGSGVLTEYLNRTRCFDPPFTEWFYPDGGWNFEVMKDSDSRPMHTRVSWLPWWNTNGTLEELCDKLPPFNKMQRVQYDYFFAGEHQISQSLPGLRYLLTSRRDLIATAISQYIASRCSRAVPDDRLNAFFVENGFLRERYEMANLPININYLWHCYRTAFRQTTEWEDFLSGEEYLEVCFECFMTNSDVREQVCDFVGVRPIKFPFEDFSTLPIRHPQKEMLTNVLKEILDSGQFKTQPEQRLPML